MSSQTKFQAMSTLDSYLYARDAKGGGPASQVQNLSWAIVLFMKQVPRQSCELDMQTSQHHTTLSYMD